MRACVLQPVFGNSPDRDPKFALDEALSLADALGVDMADSIIVQVPKPDPGRLFGAGKRAELAEQFKANDVHLVVVNAVVTPVQQRNLERDWHVKVLDRTALILEIFGERAQTREGVLQVELAHLSYQKSRLVRSWTHLERQRGGGGFLGGPGETQIEADRRALDDKIQSLKKQLEKVVKTRELHRAGRRKVPFPVVALVGYTNAGKSTIFNSVTGADVLAKDMVFATLDPTMRMLELPRGQSVILADTVGFISDLPTQLVAAFRATLEEVLNADLIVHVRDISHPETAQQSEDVYDVLGQLGLNRDDGIPIVEVWNKSDCVNAEDISTLTLLAQSDDRSALVSAMEPKGLKSVLELVDTHMFADHYDEDVELPASDGRARSWLYDRKLVQAERMDGASVVLTVRWSDKQKNQFRASN